jgi:hypothetical protein
MRFWLGGPRLFGARTGVLVGAEDFVRSRRNRAVSSGSDNSQFLYVAVNDAGLVKVGITGNPDARLSQLRYASESPVRYAWIAAPQGEALAIEQDALRALAEYQHSGEWLTASAETAIGAINTAALRRGENLLVVTLPMARRICNVIASGEAVTKPTTALGRVVVGIFQLLAGFILAALVLVFLVARLGRIF